MEKAKLVRANILKILLYSFVFIENVLTSGIAGKLVRLENSAKARAMFHFIFAAILLTVNPLTSIELFGTPVFHTLDQKNL